MPNEDITPEISQQQPDYYQRIIDEGHLPNGEPARAVAAASLVALRDGLYFGLQVDEQNLPLPSPAGESSGFNERHFRSGGTSPIVGVLDATTGTFIPLEDLQSLKQFELRPSDIEDNISATPPTLGLADICAVAQGLIERDWSDINSRRNPAQLARSAASGAVSAFLRTKLAGFDPAPGESIEESRLYQEIAQAIQDEATWSHIKNASSIDRKQFLNNLRSSYNGKNWREVENLVRRTVEVQVYSTAESTLADHTAEIADLAESRDVEDAKVVEELKRQTGLQ